MIANTSNWKHGAAAIQALLKEFAQFEHINVFRTVLADQLNREQKKVLST